MPDFSAMKGILSKGAFAAILAAVTEYYADAPQALQGLWDAVLILVLLDVVLGSFCALRSGSFTSRIFRALGIQRLAGYVVILILTLAIESATGQPYYWMTMASYYIIAGEIASILENCDKLGIALPPFIKSALKLLRNKGEEDGHPGSTDGDR